MPMFRRSLLPTLSILEPDQIGDRFADVETGWLIQQSDRLAFGSDPTFLLVHADDGIIWGRIERGQLRFPGPSAWAPMLRSQTVQQCRLFGRLGELFIWRVAEGRWRGRKLVDNPEDSYSIIIEHPFLVGDRIYDPLSDSGNSPLRDWPAGFTPIVNVATGVRQIAPCSILPGARAQLMVLHYLFEDEDGQSIIKYSRLADVK